MKDQQIIEIARIKLPAVVEMLTKANLEVQKTKPNLDALMAYLNNVSVDGFYDVADMLSARETLARIARTEAQHE